jgi:hypothetical protein
MTIRRRGAAALLAALLLAGCAGGGGPGGPASSTPAPPASTGTPASPEPSGPPPTAVPSQSLGTPETVSGQVVAGVEPHCLVLRAAGGSRLLVFDDPKLRAAARPGTSVTVTGRAVRGMMSYCQQGAPFLVTAVRPG